MSLLCCYPRGLHSQPFSNSYIKNEFDINYPTLIRKSPFLKPESLNTAKTSDSEINQICKKDAMKAGHESYQKYQSTKKPSRGRLFGMPLSKICEGGSLPTPVIGMLQELLATGPTTPGIFRKTANVRLVRELREKMDRGASVLWPQVSVLVIAAAFKEFLRSLPDPLLNSSLYPEWKEAMDIPQTHQKLQKIKGILSQLPECNRFLLRLFLCVLYHISMQSEYNLMSAANLGVCVGPSLLWVDNMTREDIHLVPALVETLVIHYQRLCGSYLPRLCDLYDSVSPHKNKWSTDSLESPCFTNSNTVSTTSLSTEQPCSNTPMVRGKVVVKFGRGEQHRVSNAHEDIQGSRSVGSSTLSSNDYKPCVSRSNVVRTKLQHLPPVHVETYTVTGRVKCKENSLMTTQQPISLSPPYRPSQHQYRPAPPPYRPPPPPFRPPPPFDSQNRRSANTSYCFGDCNKSQKVVFTRDFVKESYV